MGYVVSGLAEPRHLLTSCCTRPKSFDYKTIDEIFYITTSLSIFQNHKSTKESIAFTIGGTEVKAKVIMPNKLILRLDKAAALGSDTSNSAVAIAEEFPPNVTPRVT
jgi:hypothetical protein